MQDFKNLDTAVLINLLSLYTEEYTRMLQQNMRDEAFENCKATISLLQSIINARIQATVNTNLSETNFGFTSPVAE